MYKKFAIVTIVAVYFLILVGGIVRATGSGMGCPDWPKCFGMWVPPTHIEQLPENYQEIFGEKLKGEVNFNLFKTWTEYINRLVGVVIGFLIFLTLVFAWREFRSYNRKVVLYSFLAFVLVGAEGFFGVKGCFYRIKSSFNNYSYAFSNSGCFKFDIRLIFIKLFRVKTNTKSK